MVEKLKACPYCGGFPSIGGLVSQDGLVWRLRLCNGKHEEYATQEDARNAWKAKVCNVVEEGG